MKCPTCYGKRGWGHYSTEPDHFGRLTRVAGSDKFFACDTCKGTGEVTINVLRQSLLAEEERQRVFDNEMELVDARLAREFRNDERYYN